MWAAPYNRPQAVRSAAARNTLGAAEDANGGWESVRLFNSSSLVRPLQGSQRQRVQQQRPAPFPDNASRAAPVTLSRSASMNPGTAVVSKLAPLRPPETHTPEFSSSHPSPRVIFRMAPGRQQEHLHQELYARPSPWQGRSSMAPPAVFAGSRTIPSQTNRGVVAPNSRNQYLAGPHALYSAGRVSTPAQHASGVQQTRQLPEQAAQNSQSFSGKSSSPTLSKFPSKSSSLEASAKRRFQVSTGSDPSSIGPDKLSPPPASDQNVSVASSVVFPDAAGVDTTSSTKDQSSKGAAPPPSATCGESGTARCGKAGGKKEEEPTRKSLNPTSDEEIGTAKQEFARQLETQLLGKENFRPDLSGRLAASKQPPVTLSFGAKESFGELQLLKSSAASSGANIASLEKSQSLTGTSIPLLECSKTLSTSQQPAVSSLPKIVELPGGLRSRFILSSQQQHPHHREKSVQVRQREQSLPAASMMSGTVRPARLVRAAAGRLAPRALGSTLYHNALHALQQDASTLVPLAHLPYLGPFDLMSSPLPQTAGVPSRSVGNESGSASIGELDGMSMPHSQHECGRSTFEYDDFKTIATQLQYKKLYAQAGRQLEQLRFRGLYCPAIAIASALSCLVFLLFLLFTLSGILICYLRQQGSLLATQAAPLSVPPAFALAVLSSSAGACVFFAAVLSFLLFQNHLKMSLLYDNIDFGGGSNTTARSIPEEQQFFLPHANLPLASSVFEEVPESPSGASSVTQHLQGFLVEEYKRIYTLCACGETSALSVRATEAAKAVADLYLESLNQGGKKGKIRQDEEGEKRAKDMHHTERKTEDTVQSTSTLPRIMSTNKNLESRICATVSPLATTGPKERATSYAVAVQEVISKNLLARSDSFQGANSSAKSECAAALMTATDVRFRNFSLRTLWLNVGCAIAATGARVILSLLLSRAVPGSSTAWAQQLQGVVKNSPGAAPHSAADGLFFPAQNPSSQPTAWWKRLILDYSRSDGSFRLLPRMSSLTRFRTSSFPLPASATSSTSPSFLLMLWMALNRLAVFQTHLAGIMALLQFTAMALLVQPRESLHLTSVMAWKTALLQLGIGFVELFFADTHALTLILGEVALQEVLLGVVLLAGQHVLQLSRENFAAKIIYRSKLPATASTAAAAGALLASACSVRGADAVASKEFLVEKPKQLRWGNHSN